MKSPIAVAVLLVAAASIAPAAAQSQPKPDKPGARTVVVSTPGRGDVQVDIDDDIPDMPAPPAPPRPGRMAKRGYLGVSLLDLTPDLRAFFGAPQDAGVLVSHVEADSPAAKAGIKVGDVLTGADGQKIGSSTDIQRRVRVKKDKETASFEVWRDRRSRTIVATLVERERPEIDFGDVLMFRRGDERFAVPFDPNQINEQVERMQKRLQSPEFQERMRRAQDMEKRLQEMEKRLKEMEQKLKERSAASSDQRPS